MKIYCTFISLLYLSTLSNTVLANSRGENIHFKNMKKVSLKCDLVYVGGKRGIHYHYDLPKKLRDSFESDIMKIKSADGRKIYKVNQCVEINKKFNDSTANTLDKQSMLEG